MASNTDVDTIQPEADKTPVVEVSKDDPEVVVKAMESSQLNLLSDPSNEKCISNSTSLLSLLDSYEGLVDIAHRNQVYTTTYPFTDADVQGLAWIFTYGRLDGWTDKIATFTVVTSFRDYIQTPALERIETPILRLSAALRVLPQQDKEKVKYVIVSQCRNSPVSYKLLVSFSREAVGMDMFYELLNGNSVVFVGAVPKHVAIPVETPTKLPAIKFKRVESVEAFDLVGMADGHVGIMC